MDKRKLSKIPREAATDDMMELAGRFKKVRHIVTAELVEDKKILLMNFFEVSDLKKGKTEAVFRTFLSDSDYITQDLKTSKTKWLTASLVKMDDFDLFEHRWDDEKEEWIYNLIVYVRSDEEVKIITDFFKNYSKNNEKYSPWTEIKRFQESVKDKRLEERHKKVTDKIDEIMKPIKDAPEEFFNWVWETGMGFSRYLIYKEVKKGIAECECTYCKKTGTVDRKSLRLRNNEKGVCPFCGSRVTIKAQGKMPAQIWDERWFMYVDPTKDGFILRYFMADRKIRSDSYLNGAFVKNRVEQHVYEYKRCIYTFDEQGCTHKDYEWGVYHQRGNPRWCPENGKIYSKDCILYPLNLPEAWEHTPMKYSALEILANNLPTVSMEYEDGIKSYAAYPFLEWMIKMGLNQIAKGVLEMRFMNQTGKLNPKGKTIWEILRLDKVNTRTLQQIDGNYEELRLLQVAQEIGMQMKSEQLREYYESFGCNTDFLKESGRKVSLHKLVKYITRESENYPIGDAGCRWRYSYMRSRERDDIRIERKQNTAKDWLEYIKWCREMKYDLDNPFIYMPKNFKKVHDRTAKEYQAFKDEKLRKTQEMMERKIKRIMEDTEKNKAVMMKRKGLLIVVPKCAEEIRKEGRALHHCVGTYVERVARGETLILFVRREENPEEPYFTMEFKNGKVAQCRGKNNCAMPKDVKAFVEEFEKRMNKEEENRLKIAI